MKKLLFILLIFPVFAFSQDKPCIIYEKSKYSTGPHPETVPVFPGCEIFINNNDSLNHCARNIMGTQIADKLEMEFFPDAKMDSALSYYKVLVIMDVDVFGKLDLNLKEKTANPFEDSLEKKLNEIANEIVGIIPAISENGYCLNYRYSLPVRFNED